MLFILLLNLVNSLHFEISGRGSKKCFSLYSESKSEVTMTYIISGKKDQSIFTTLANPVGALLYASPPRTREGKLEIRVQQTGTYFLCFESKDSSSKTISFDFFPSNTQEDLQFLTGSQTISLKISLHKLGGQFDSVFRNLQFYESREKIHRDLTEKTCNLIFNVILFKTLVLTLVTLGQLSVLKGFFSAKLTQI